MWCVQCSSVCRLIDLFILCLGEMFPIQSLIILCHLVIAKSGILVISIYLPPSPAPTLVKANLSPGCQLQEYVLHTSHIFSFAYLQNSKTLANISSTCLWNVYKCPWASVNETMTNNPQLVYEFHISWWNVYMSPKDEELHMSGRNIFTKLGL